MQRRHAMIQEGWASLLPAPTGELRMGRARFDSNGNLPPGVVSMTLEQVKEAFTWTPRRQALFAGLGTRKV